MCWNKEVSLFSFVIICVVSYALYKRDLKNDKFLTFFIMSYGSMQLFEFLIWLGIDTNKIYLNKIGSILASILLYLHPLAIIIGMSLDKAYKKYTNNPYYKILFLASVILVLFGIYNIIFHMNKKNKTYKFLSYPDKISKHLVWDFPDHYHYVIVLSLLISIFIFLENKLFWLVIFVYYFAPWVLIKLNMTVDKINKTKNYNGSYWCWYVAAFSFILYFMNSKLQN